MWFPTKGRTDALLATMYLRQAGLTCNPTFRIFIPFGVGDKAWLRKPRSNANTHVSGNYNEQRNERKDY